MYLSGSTINIDSSASVLSGYVSNNLADDTINLKNDKVYIYHGSVDYTVTEGMNRHQKQKIDKFVYSNHRYC